MTQILFWISWKCKTSILKFVFSYLYTAHPKVRKCGLDEWTVR